MFRKFINLLLIALIVLILAYIAKDFFAGSDGGDEDSPRRDGRTAVAKPAKRDGTSRRTDVKPVAKKTAKRVAAGDAQATEADGDSSADSEPGEEDEQDLVIKAVREWETQVDDWVREDNRVPLASRGKKAKAAIAKVPESERMVAIQTLLNLLPDESFAMMEPILMDPKENPDPGRIMVQIAMAPQRAMNQRSEVVSVGERRQMNAPNTTPKTSQQISLPFHPLMSESMNMAETMISPKKNAHVCTGW